MKNILIIVDAQNDFCHEKGALSSKEACEAADNIIKMLNKTAFDKIICTMDTHGDNYSETSEGKHLPIPHCKKNTWGWKIREDLYQELYNQQNVSFLEKEKFSPYPTQLWTKVGIVDKHDKIYVCGLCTDICVISTAFAVKNNMEPEVYLIENCCAGSTPENHFFAVSVMKSCHINIIKGELPPIGITDENNKTQTV